MPRERLHWVHPNALRYSEQQASGRYLHYFRHWESFTLMLRDYRFTRWFASHSTNGRDEDPIFLAAAEKLSKEGWEALTKEEQEAFEQSQMRQILPEAMQDGIRFEGWGELEGGNGQEEIASVSVDNDPRWRSSRHDENYQKTFRRLRVSIGSAPEEHHGSMWVWGESMREFVRDDSMPTDQDVLFVQFYMLPEKLKALAREVTAQTVKPVLLLHAQGLMFRDEVAAALSENWHPREYVIIYDHHTPAILDSLSFDMMASTPPQVADDEDDSLTVSTVDPVRTPDVSKPAVAQYAGQVKGLKYAIWGLAAAVILSALI